MELRHSSLFVCRPIAPEYSSDMSGRSERDVFGNAVSSRTPREVLIRAVLTLTAYRWMCSVTDAGKRAAKLFQDPRTRFYELVNGLMRGQISQASLSADDMEEFLFVSEELPGLIEAYRLPIPMTVYHGVRSYLAVFGPGAPEELIGREIVLPGFLSTSPRRGVVQREFVRPDGGALLRLRLPRGTPAAWLGGVGLRTLRYQDEVLLSHMSRILVTGVRREADVLIVVGEVVYEPVRRQPKSDEAR